MNLPGEIRAEPSNGVSAGEYNPGYEIDIYYYSYCKYCYWFLYQFQCHCQSNQYHCRLIVLTFPKYDELIVNPSIAIFVQFE